MDNKIPLAPVEIKQMKECPICGREVYENPNKPYKICIVCRTVGPDRLYYIPEKGKLVTIFHKERIPKIPVEEMRKLYEEYYQQVVEHGKQMKEKSRKSGVKPRFKRSYNESK